MVFASSCLADLDVKPTELIDGSLAFKTVEDLNAGVLGVYAGVGTNTIWISTLMSDEATCPLEYTGTKGREVYTWKQEAVYGDIGLAWQNFYQVIDRANRVLEAADDVAVLPQDESLKSQYKGELLAMRAYCHFELLRHYAVSYDMDAMAVPVMLRSELTTPARDSVRRVYRQVNEDLDNAATLIPASFTNKNRITRLAVFAMKARAAQWQQDWDGAIAAATEVINAVPLATITEFPDIWTDKSNAEVIWKLKREAQDAKIGEYFVEAGGRLIYAPSFKLIGTMDAANDIRFAAYIKDLTPAASTRRWSVNKYVGGQAAFVNLADVKMFRTGEMYLIRAEAHARKGLTGLPAGIADLNTLRAQRIRNYTSALFATPEGLLQAVMEERYKELAFEGHRYFDLRREGLPIERLPEDAVKYPDALTLTPDDKGYYIPIPLKEMQANKQLKQHPKYPQ